MKYKKTAPIGVFDSGVGGLTVAREIMRNLPHEKIVYFGDTARVPYGSKSKETILRYSRQIVRFLQTQEVKAIVVACNTASALALETISEEIDIPIIGVVKPGAKVAAQTTRNKKIGLIGTRATVKSDLYRKTIQAENPEIEVIGQPCPLFVPLVEEGWLKDSVTIEVAKRYLAPLLEKDIDTLILGCTHYPLPCPLFVPLVEEGWLKDSVTIEVAKRYLAPLLEKDIDTLILGCTHYPLLRSTLKTLVGDGVTLVNPAYETAKELQRLLKEQGMENEIHTDEEFPYRFFVSDEEECFQEFANSILPYNVKRTEQINIEEF